MNKERGFIVADNAFFFTFAKNNFLDSGFSIYSSKFLLCVVALDIPLKIVDTYLLSLAFVGEFIDVKRVPSKSVQSNWWRALQYKLWV